MTIKNNGRRVVQIGFSLVVALGLWSAFSESAQAQYGRPYRNRGYYGYAPRPYYGGGYYRGGYGRPYYGGYSAYYGGGYAPYSYGAGYGYGGYGGYGASYYAPSYGGGYYAPYCY
jgi:hypothetical protein